jgi:hypothetical protein
MRARHLIIAALLGVGFSAVVTHDVFVVPVYEAGEHFAGTVFGVASAHRVHRLAAMFAGAAVALPGIVIALLACAYLGRRGRVTETRCRKCGYILRGITEPRCPECGERI